MMISMKVVRNFVKNETNYDIFPLAAIFGTPHISLPRILRGDIWGVPNMAARGKMS